MSERMTDKEITSLEQSLFGCEGSTVHKARRLIEALKAERAEVARLTQRKEFWKDEATCYRDDYEAAVAVRPNQLMLIADKQRAEAKLRAVGELPGKWRSWRYGGKNTCADELEALLETNDEPPTRPIQGGYLEKDTTTGEVHEPTTERDWTSDAWSK